MSYQADSEEREADIRFSETSILLSGRLNYNPRKLQ